MKSSLAQRIGQLFFYLLMAVSVVAVVLFYLRNSDVNPDDPFSKQMVDLGSILDFFTYWAYILTGLAVFFTLIFPIVHMFNNPKSAVKTLISIAILGIILFIGYSLADDTILQIPGYDGPDNIPERLKLTGMGIYTMYFMMAGALLAVGFSWVSKLIR